MITFKQSKNENWADEALVEKYILMNDFEYTYWPINENGPLNQEVFSTNLVYESFFRTSPILAQYANRQ